VFCKDGADTYQSFGSYREGKIGLFRIAGVKDGLSPGALYKRFVTQETFGLKEILESRLGRYYR
jgi:hypothetical protein